MVDPEDARLAAVDLRGVVNILTGVGFVVSRGSNSDLADLIKAAAAVSALAYNVALGDMGLGSPPNLSGCLVTARWLTEICQRAATPLDSPAPTCNVPSEG